MNVQLFYSLEKDFLEKRFQKVLILLVKIKGKGDAMFQGTVMIAHKAHQSWTHQSCNAKSCSEARRPGHWIVIFMYQTNNFELN